MAIFFYFDFFVIVEETPSYLTETSPFLICPNGFAEQFLSSICITWCV
jgi:hypothetical protein